MSRPAPESQAPPFRFSSRTNSKTSLSNSASLEDMFGESPQRERPVLRTHSSGNVSLNSRLGRPFAPNSGSNARGCGSPASIRKSGHPFMRPRKLCRRSLSMFEHPDDVIADNEANYTANSPLQAIADVEGTAPTLQLPHAVPEDQGDALPRIDKNVLLEVMNGKYNECFENIVIIDCRFEYEYEGGHINGAVNYNDKETLAAQLFAEPRPRTALILHCEYSVHRAPIMAKYLRHRDRAFNADQYPQLCYPDMYILDGGYSAFFAENRSFCYPQNYVEMSAKEHEHACERGLGKVKQRSKLNRAQTYAFGELSPEMQDSPTGRCRNFGTSDRLLSSPFDDSPAPSRTPGRRMLSY